ncbi:MAG: helix-turn-helix domain-containing protein [Acetobacteraceae bacterium]|nr:AraC family transcriptional regulator [Pseudomonadota bacterium]
MLQDRQDEATVPDTADAAIVSPLPGALLFDDPDRFGCHLQQVHAEITIVGGGRYRAGLQIVPVGSVVLQRGWQLPAHIGRVSMPADRCLLLFSPRADQPPSHVARSAVAFTDMVYAPGGSQEYCRGARDTQWEALSPSFDALTNAAETLIGTDLSRLRSTRVISPDLSAGLHLRDLTRRVATLAATTPQVLAHPEVVRAIADSLLRAMTACLSGAEDRHRETRVGTGRGAAIIRRLEAFLEANADRAVHLTELCMATGVKARALRYWCNDYLGVGPVRYLHLRRMHLARRALLHGNTAATSVTRVASDFGFAELGRFAVGYRRLFGESPSATLRRSV